jgi:NAD(P)-dependent dehydrogenase (short-subunit alcohol dehydrogenase family)
MSDTMLPFGLDLTGKVALVTGAGGGLGFAIARQLADMRAQVVCTDRVERPEEDISRQDVRSLQDWRSTVDRIVERHGRLDILIHAAGFYRPNIPFEALTLDMWRDHMEINLESALLGCQTAMPAIGESGGGAIVLFSSTLASQPTPESLAYSCAKAGIELLTRTAARQGGPSNVRVNAIAPGPIDTPMLRGNIPEGGDAEALFAKLAGRVPLGRLGTRADAAHLAAFLCSDAAAFVTGAIIPLDGGQTS